MGTGNAVTLASPPLGEFQSTGIAREAAHPSVNATEAQKKTTLMPLSR